MTFARKLVNNFSYCNEKLFCQGEDRKGPSVKGSIQQGWTAATKFRVGIPLFSGGCPLKRGGGVGKRY